VSREYKLPAVVGTGNATSRIKTGDHLRVDGDTGVVTILA
jgi:pyruvate,water dikinase